MTVQGLADTHALIWYLFDEERLSPSGLAALDGAIEAGFPILVSTISIIEIVYLVEKHRINVGAVVRIREACEAEDPSIEIVPVDAIPFEPERGHSSRENDAAQPGLADPRGRSPDRSTGFYPLA